MRILMLTTKFSLDASDGWLTNDLAEAFSAKGHEVDVINLDWGGMGQIIHKMMYNNKIEILHIPASKLISHKLPRFLRLALKWAFSSLLALRMARPHYGKRHYDLLIGFSPAVTSFWLAKYFRAIAKKTYLILWDFFPIYHLETGVFQPPPLMTYAVKLMERKAIEHYQVIGFMSQANIDFFERYHPKTSLKKEVLSLWGSSHEIHTRPKEETRRKLGIGQNRIVCVFGGQLIPGRSIENILSAAEIISTKNPDILFVFAGSGPLELLIRKYTEKLSNILYLGQLNREDYMDLLVASDIGLVFTTVHISVPPFSSKTIDYFRAKLPILGAVERSGDYGKIIETQIHAGLVSSADDITQICQNILTLSADPIYRTECGKRGYEYFMSHMTAEKIADQIMKA